jgi:outer membrane murein-binding lipoprotein Lpp
MKTWIFFVSVILISVCAAAGCVQPTQEQAQAQLCQDLVDLGAALDNFATINVTSTVGDIRDAEDQVTAAMQNVRQSAGQLATVRIDELDTAYNNLDNAVQSLPDDITAAEALQTLRPDLQAVLSARQNLTAELNCPQQ